MVVTCNHAWGSGRFPDISTPDIPRTIPHISLGYSIPNNLSDPTFPHHTSPTVLRLCQLSATDHGLLVTNARRYVSLWLFVLY